MSFSHRLYPATIHFDISAFYVNVKINQDAIPIMANQRLVIATVLATVAFALALFGILSETSIMATPTGTSGHAGLAASHFGGLSASHVPGLIALASSIAAFVASWRQRSYLVAGLLIGAGILYSMHISPFLGDHSVIALFGPVIGLFFGHVILALGVVKALGSVRTPVAKTIT